MQSRTPLRPCLALTLLLAIGCSSQGIAPEDGGTGGTGGSGGGVDTCDQLLAAYAGAFDVARTCNPNLDNIQCGLMATSSLQCPGCMVHVNDTTALDQIRAMWETAHCPPAPCPAIACVVASGGACVAHTDGGPPGTCVEVYQ